jgi:hypothetical protein
MCLNPADGLHAGFTAQIDDGLQFEASPIGEKSLDFTANHVNRLSSPVSITLSRPEADDDRLKRMEIES